MNSHQRRVARRRKDRENHKCIDYRDEYLLAIYRMAGPSNRFFLHPDDYHRLLELVGKKTAVPKISDTAGRVYFREFMDIDRSYAGNDSLKSWVPQV